MGENGLVNNEGVVETVSEAYSRTSGLSKLVIVGAVVAVGVAVVIFVRNRKAKLAVSKETVVEEKVNSKKTEK